MTEFTDSYPEARWSSADTREIIERIVVEGTLRLTEPAHLGNGEDGDFVDHPLLVGLENTPGGATSPRPLLTGDSLAGAIRAYLRTRTFGYRSSLVANEDKGSAVLLLGGSPGDDEGRQSSLIVDDAWGRLPRTEEGVHGGVTVREGVRIDPKTRAAQQGKLYDLEAWPAGTTFPLRFELLVSEEDDKQLLCMALLAALEGLQEGEITFGLRKRRGFGKAKAGDWRVRRYNLATNKGLLQWLKEGAEEIADEHTVEDLKFELGVQSQLKDERIWFECEVDLFLQGSLLIRSGLGSSADGPDMIHLHSLHDGRLKPIVSGSSLAGGLRARALKIAKSVSNDEDVARGLVDAMFGTDLDHSDQAHASRIETREAVIQNGETDLIQTRVSIDRFTGGAFPGALFDQRPVFGGEDTSVSFRIRLIKPSDAQREQDPEIGLLLLLLKDLWTGDLPLGSESTVGRGRFHGIEATFVLYNAGERTSWTITQDADGLVMPDDAEILERHVKAFNRHLAGEENNDT